jgi:hypothetical protein
MRQEVRRATLIRVGAGTGFGFWFWIHVCALTERGVPRIWRLFVGRAFSGAIAGVPRGGIRFHAGDRG